MAPVVQRPQLGPLVPWLPLTELVAHAEDTLLGPRSLLVAAAATEDGVMPALGDRIEQWHGLQRVPGAVGSLTEPTVIDVVLDGSDLEGGAVELDGLVAELQHLGEVVAGVHVQHPEWDRSRPESLRRQVQHDDRVLATGEEHDRRGECGRDLTNDVNRLGLERLQLAQRS